MKSTFKKLTALLMALMLLLATFGCSSDSDKDDEKEKEGVEDSVAENESVDKDNIENSSTKLTFTDYGCTISANQYHTVALKSDGTVVAVGDNEHGQCNVSGWTDVVKVSTGLYHTVGLKSDGTVVATEYIDTNDIYDDYEGWCEVSGWTDIIAVSAGSKYTLGLKSDGTVVAVGVNKYGQCDVSGWTDIVAIAAGDYHTVGLKSDGTVVAVGENGSGQCDVSEWTDIVAIAAGYKHTVAVKADGTAVAVGFSSHDCCEVGDWTDIIAVSADDDHTVGVKADGTVVAIGYNVDGRCNVSDWDNIVAISAGFYHTIGLKADGTVVAVGDNDEGQCDVGGLADIKISENINTDGFVNKPDKADKNTSTVDVNKLNSATAGMYLTFGSYEQDNNESNGKEPLEWLVLAKEGDRLLVISKYVIDSQMYNEERGVYTTWETSTLRGWLNNDFINTAFSSQEQSMIPTVTVVAEVNPEYETDPGNDTQDKLFLLGIEETNKYFTDDMEKTCTATAFAIGKGVNVNSENNNSWWWLRPCGDYLGMVAFVYGDGEIYNNGSTVDSNHGGVRPAMWINL